MNRWRILLWPALAMLIALGILLALGTWQMQRLYEKEALIARLNAVLTSTPTALNPISLPAITVASSTGTGTGTGSKTTTPDTVQEFLRVSITGTYIQSRSVPVRATFPAPKNAKSLGGLGFFWMTPLQIDGGPVVFINRGFVPAGADTKAPPILTPEGTQTIVGLVRSPETRQTFTPADQPQRGEYFIRDPKVLSEAVAIKQAALGFFVDAERIGDGLTAPVGINSTDMIGRISNNHLQYAVTWYGFALTLLGVFGFFARARLRDQARSKTLL
jgi:surfeit locus 1 family protein